MTTPQCRHCSHPATHVILSHTFTCHEEAVPAKQAPLVLDQHDIAAAAVERRAVKQVHPTPYYCQAHAAARQAAGVRSLTSRED